MNAKTPYDVLLDILLEMTQFGEGAARIQYLGFEKSGSPSETLARFINWYEHEFKEIWIGKTLETIDKEIETFFNIENEIGLREWCRKHLDQLNIKRIINSRSKCPDWTVEMKDGSIRRIEFEYDSKNFKAHQHTIDDVDLLIAYKGNPHPNLDTFIIRTMRFYPVNLEELWEKGVAVGGTPEDDIWLLAQSKKRVRSWHLYPWFIFNARKLLSTAVKEMKKDEP